MAVIVESSGGNFEKAPEGVHFAVCVGVWDIGTQPSDLYKPARKVVLCWELVGETAADGKPFTISQSFTMSLHEKSTLRPKIEAWRGKVITDAEAQKFDLATLLGRPCQLQVTHKESNGKTYANVTSIMAIPKGVPPMQAKTPLSEYTITMGENFPDPMPEYFRKKVRESHEFTKPKAAEQFKDDIEHAFHATTSSRPNPAANLPKMTATEPLPWEESAPTY